MKMSVNKPRKNGASGARDLLRTRRNERVKLSFCASRQNPPGSNRYCLGDRTRRIKGENPPAAEQKVGSG